MPEAALLNQIYTKKKRGLLDYKWDVRLYLLNSQRALSKINHKLFDVCVSPFVYISKHKPQIEKDVSLKAVCRLCTDLNLVIDVDHQDHVLTAYAQLFNRLTDSGRGIHACYDCGTTARGIFFQLINAYRGHFSLKPEEIKEIKNEYYMSRYQGAQGVTQLRNKIHQIDQNCLFLCAMQLGEDFGHIYIIEKIYIKRKPRYRIYQSCFNAFLLVDYIEAMDYAKNLSKGVDIDTHLDAIEILFSKPNWSMKDIDSFVYWYKFYPMHGTGSTDEKTFTFTHVKLGDAPHRGHI